MICGMKIPPAVAGTKKEPETPIKSTFPVAPAK